MLNLSEAKNQIRQAGASNVRIVPAQDQGVDGDHQIEVRTASGWRAVMTSLSRTVADQMVRECLNTNQRVILG